MKCPLITIKGKVFCLAYECEVRNIRVCPPLARRIKTK